MFTLTRIAAFVLMGVLGYFSAQAYVPIYAVSLYVGNFPSYMAVIGALCGWMYLGGRMGRGWIMAAYMGVQTAVLIAVAGAMIFALQRVWVQGYRMRYQGDIGRAFESYFDILTGYLLKALTLDPLLQVLGAAAVVGVVLQLIFNLLERRRLG